MKIIGIAVQRTVFLAALICIPAVTMAWGVVGHRVVGEIADSYLSAKTKAEIKKILGTESIAMASNWADFVKSDRSYDYLNTWHYVNIPGGLASSQVAERLRKDTATDLYTKLRMVIG